jgi:hypothetical protein
MKTLRFEDLNTWFLESASNVEVQSSDHLRFEGSKTFSCRIDVPLETMRVVALVYSLLSVESETRFYGGLIWYTNWGMGTPEIEQCGLRMLEQMRRGYGAVESIENAPVQVFRSDELVDAQAFMVLPLLWGWDAYFKPHSSRYFAYARQNRSLYLVSDDEQVFNRLLSALSSYSPVLELPTYLRSAFPEAPIQPN